MVLMLCAFYMQLFILNSNIIVNVTVLPHWGFYSFVIATMLSLGLGHCVLACHRLVCERDRDRLRDKETERERRRASGEFLEGEGGQESEISRANERALKREREEELTAHTLSALEYFIELPHELFDTHDNQIEKERHRHLSRCVAVKLTRWGELTMLLAIFGSGVLVYLGDWLITMGFEFKGLVGLMLKDQASPQYSFMSLTKVLPAHSGVPGDFAVRWLQASVYLFGVAMPFFLLFLCMVLWHIPLSLQKQRVVLVLCEIAQAWGAIDVFCVSIAAALLEIQQFAAFVVGDACDRINVLLADYMDTLLDGDDKCFDVIATLESVCLLQMDVFRCSLFILVILFSLCWLLRNLGQYFVQQEHCCC
jgi:hypothetical protein